MPLAQAVLAILLALPAPYCPPRATACTTPTQRRQHLERVSLAIARAADKATCTGQPGRCKRIWWGPPRELAAVLVAVGFWESRFSRRVQAGLCPWSGCSAANRAAHSDWQIERSPVVSAATWRDIVGLGQPHVDRAAWTSARLLALARGQCAPRGGPHWLARTISGYARGSSCTWPGVTGRVNLAWAVDWRLYRLTHKRQSLGRRLPTRDRRANRWRERRGAVHTRRASRR